MLISSPPATPCADTRAGQEGLPALPPAVASRHEELQVSAGLHAVGSVFGRGWLGIYIHLLSNVLGCLQST